MNPSNPTPHPEFSNRDLIELAQLDALGLLDEAERQSFEQAFKSAPASIQQLVRDSQARASQIDSWLPDVQPPVSLRERVLAAVSAAVRSENRRPEVAGRLTPQISRSTTVAPYWRAVAIGSMAAALLFGVVTVKLYGDFQSMNNTLHANKLADEWLKDFGPKFEHMLTSEKTQFVQFSPASGAARGSALLLLDGESANAQFLAKDLPQIEGGYTLALLDSTGNVVKTIAQIDTQSSRSVKQFANLKIDPGQSLALKSAGETVLKSRNL